MLDARGEARKLKRTFEHSHVPMVMVDAKRRYVEVNRPARMWFRLSLEEMRAFALGDLTPAPRKWIMEQAWARLLDVGCVAGRYPVYASDGSAFLTPREIEVLALAADGLSGSDLAQELFVRPSTVHTHFRNIYSKLAARNRTAAVAKAMRLGVIR